MGGGGGGGGGITPHFCAADGLSVRARPAPALASCPSVCPTVLAGAGFTANAIFCMAKTFSPLRLALALTLAHTHHFPIAQSLLGKPEHTLSFAASTDYYYGPWYFIVGTLDNIINSCTLKLLTTYYSSLNYNSFTLFI